jgi:redox-sensitive bicupin YhaK (pirin superfamily)
MIEVADQVLERAIVRRGADRGYAEHGWLKSFHSFSFADYHDAAHMHFGPLRVINEDFVAPSSGFGTHGHRDMEILTVVLEGVLTHKDSMASGGDAGATIGPGEVQRMSAGRGVLHSEFNRSATTPVHLLQIWVMPNVLGIPSSYEQKRFDDAAKRGRLALVASPDGRDGSLTIRADASLSLGLFDGAEEATFDVADDRLAYVHVARGSIVVDGIELAAGDALKVVAPGPVTIAGGRGAEILVFDLAR